MTRSQVFLCFRLSSTKALVDRVTYLQIMYVQYTINIYQTFLELGAKFFLKRRKHCMSKVCSTRSIFRLKAQFFKMGRRIKSQCKYGGPPRPALTEGKKKLIWDLALTCHCGSSTLTNQDFGPLVSFRQRKLGGPPMPDTVWHFQRFVAQSMSGWPKHKQT